MELEGTVKQLLEPVTGESAKGPWKRQEFVIETKDDYPKMVCFTVWNDKIDVSQLQEGLAVTVYFNLSSREHNGKWFTSATAWRVNAGGDGGGSDVVDPEPPEAPSQEVQDDLPF